MPERYDPVVVEFDAPSTLHTFEDGWQLLELRESDDLDKLGAATKNCVRGSTWGPQLLPGVEDERQALRDKFKAQWDTPKNREQFGDTWVEKRVAGAETCPLPKRYHKIMALVDGESRAHAAVILGQLDAVVGRLCSYASYDDLGQERKNYVELDGDKFVLLQATFSISWMPEDVAEHCAEWWMATCVGDWHQEGFAAKVDQYNRNSYYVRA